MSERARTIAPKLNRMLFMSSPSRDCDPRGRACFLSSRRTPPSARIFPRALLGVDVRRQLDEVSVWVAEVERGHRPEGAAPRDRPLLDRDAARLQPGRDRCGVGGGDEAEVGRARCRPYCLRL